MGVQIKATRVFIAYRLTRPHTLTGAVQPVLIGSALAWQQDRHRFAAFLAMMIASLLIQIATNLFNEVYDVRNGVDTTESRGASGAVAQGEIAGQKVLAAGLGCLLAAVPLGVYLSVCGGWWIAAVGLLSMAVGYLYTGGPYPLAYRPFGELLSGLFMGPVIVVLAYAAQTGAFSWRALAVSVPIGLLLAVVVLSNNIRDMEQDRRGGRTTLPLLLGRRRSAWLMNLLVAAAYLWSVGLVGWHLVPPWTLIALLSVPVAVRTIQPFFHAACLQADDEAMRRSTALHACFGLLYFCGLCV